MAEDHLGAQHLTTKHITTSQGHISNAWVRLCLHMGHGWPSKPMKDHEKLVVGFIPAVVVICWALTI